MHRNFFKKLTFTKSTHLKIFNGTKSIILFNLQTTNVNSATVQGEKSLHSDSDNQTTINRYDYHNRDQ